jgi:hypothetical protein
VAQAISYWLFTAEARVRSQISPREFYGGQSGTVRGLLRVLRFSPSCHYYTALNITLVSRTSGRSLGPFITVHFLTRVVSWQKNASKFSLVFNPLNAELNPIRHLLALAGDRHFVHVSRIRVKSHPPFASTGRRPPFCPR